jgi:hypothetical protein
MNRLDRLERFGQELPPPERMGPMARGILARIQGPAPTYAGFVWHSGRDLTQDVLDYLANARKVA